MNKAYIDDLKSMKPISIRLPEGLIEELKSIADKDGIKYQALIRDILVAYIEKEETSEKSV